MPHSPSDQEFLNSISKKILQEFRDYAYTRDFIKRNPSKFANSDWIDVASLCDFIKERGASTRHAINVTSSPVLSPILSPVTKLESFDDIELSPGLGFVKQESKEPIEILSSPVRVRVTNVGGHEVMEILDSSDDESELGDLFEGAAESEQDLLEAAFGDSLRSDSDEDEELDEAAYAASDSATTWLDDDVATVKVIRGKTSVTRCLQVAKVEFLDGIPSAWPTPQEAVAYVLDLNDKKYNLKDKNGKLLSVDALMKNKDRDSWSGGTGNGDNPADIIDLLGRASITVRRSRLSCEGVWACALADPALFQITQYELDPDVCQTLADAQLEAQRMEGASTVKKTTVYYHVLNKQWASLCLKYRGAGNSCDGKPVMKFSKKNSGYFIGCSKWSPEDRKHRTLNIADFVSEDVLALLFEKGRVTDSDTTIYDTGPCPNVVSSKIGAKLTHCTYAHIVNGEAVRSEMVFHKCPAKRTAFVPLEMPEPPKVPPPPSALRKVVIFHKLNRPHNHVVTSHTRLSYEAKDIYREYVRAARIWSVTVQSVENAPSTKLIMKGKTPALFNDGLIDQRAKKDIITEIKKTVSPLGLGIEGVFHLLQAENKAKPIDKRYIQGMWCDGPLAIVLTFDAFLLSLIHEAFSFEVDHTFKRVKGFNEWEIVMYSSADRKTITIGRAYTNGQDRTYYKRLFDELQATVLKVTSKPLRFKRLTRGGNLLCLNSDLELAQLQGFGDSFLPTNDPEYSGINATRGDDILPFVVKLCRTHVKRAIKEFKGLVTSRDYTRLKNFPSLKEHKFPEFEAFIKELNIPEISSWWKHKKDIPWILPAIMDCKTLMAEDDWKITPFDTNIGEAQHRWSNKETGTNLPLLDAIKSAEQVDRRVALEIKNRRSKGITPNRNSSLQHKLARGVKRNTNAADKQRIAHNEELQVSSLRQKIEVLKNGQKQTNEQLKALEGELREKIGRQGSKSKSGDSCGRVKTPKQRLEVARAATAPYPTTMGTSRNPAPTPVVPTQPEHPTESMMAMDCELLPYGHTEPYPVYSGDVFSSGVDGPNVWGMDASVHMDIVSMTSTDTQLPSVHDGPGPSSAVSLHSNAAAHHLSIFNATSSHGSVPPPQQDTHHAIFTDDWYPEPAEWQVMNGFLQRHPSPGVGKGY